MFESNTHNPRLDSILYRPKQKIRRQPVNRQLGSETSAGGLFRQPTAKRTGSGRPFYRRRGFWIGAVATVLLAAGWQFGSTAYRMADKIFENKNPISLISSFGQLFTTPDRPLKGESDNRINILLLGIGGEGHEGSLLTDTIILASIRPASEDQEAAMTMISIPRDYVVKLPAGLDYRKINSAYAYGELNGKNLGAKWITEAVEEISGLAIPYYALIDFSGFRQAIDDLGGIDVDVERAFSDSYYPDNRKGYLPTIRFEKGLQHMDGEKALQYSRSRHGTNGEGSDFARSRRQQKVISAMKEKAMKLKISSDLGTISKLIGNFADHFKTNLEPWEIRRLYQTVQEIPGNATTSLSLDPATGLVCNEIAQETGAYILTRCSGVSPAAIEGFFEKSFAYAKIAGETPNILILNSTKSVGLAQRAKSDVPRFGSGEVASGNYPGSTLQNNLIYDLAGGTKPASAEYLANAYSAEISESPYPHSDTLPQTRPDFIIVLGEEAVNRYPPTTTTTTMPRAATSTPPAINPATATGTPSSTPSR